MKIIFIVWVGSAAFNGGTFSTWAECEAEIATAKAHQIEATCHLSPPSGSHPLIRGAKL